MVIQNFSNGNSEHDIPFALTLNCYSILLFYSNIWLAFADNAIQKQILFF